MRWEERLLDLFEDLEQQAEGLHLADRDLELVDRGRAEYAHVELTARVQASLDEHVRLSVAGVGVLEGRLARAGSDWCLLRSFDHEWIVRLDAVEQCRGLSAHAVPEAARPAPARLSLRAALRRVAETRSPALFHHLSGERVLAQVLRVGADFVEVLPADVETAPSAAAVLPFGRLAAVRPA